MSGRPLQAAPPPGRDDWRAELRREYAQVLPHKYVQIDRRLGELARAPADGAALEALLVEVHRLHGSAGSYGFSELSRLAGEWEVQLRALRDAGGRLSPDALEPMWARLDALRRLPSAEPLAYPTAARAPASDSSPDGLSG